MELEAQSSHSFSTPFNSPHFLSGIDSDSVSVDSGINDKEPFSYSGMSSTNDSMSEISLSSESVMQNLSHINSCEVSPCTSTATLQEGTNTEPYVINDTIWSQGSLEVEQNLVQPSPPLSLETCESQVNGNGIEERQNIFALPRPCTSSSNPFLTPSTSTSSHTRSSSATSHSIASSSHSKTAPAASNRTDSSWFFETDHLALKGNSDYQNLLCVITMLESQRTKGIRDLDLLLEGEKQSLENPLEFVQKLQRGQSMDLPGPQPIVQIPKIDWDQYTINESLDWGKHKHMTRNKKSIDLSSLGLQRVNSPASEDESSNYNGSIKDSKEVVRGRLKKENKSVTFNQLWTAEEQKQLEELLIVFPPEEVEAKRWSKIAKALGNRTTQQVASRVQKYFIKLAKAGLPVPGRMPNKGSMVKGNAHRHQRNNKFLFPQSTFLQAYEPPVYMSDDDNGDDFMIYENPTSRPEPEPEDTISDEEDVPLEMRNSEEYRELMKLKLLKQKRRRQEEANQHIGFRCDRCNMEPIVGVRWHCADCPPNLSVDFCKDCVDSEYENATHDSSHRLIPKKPKGQLKSSQIDRDYHSNSFMPGDYNYLDPNYMPAT